MERPDPDAELMLRFQQGDESAYATLVGRFTEPILNLAWKFLGSRTEAEDLAQEVFLRVFRARKSYTVQAKFSTWLYRVTANACLNRIKSKTNERVRSLHSTGEDGRELGRSVQDPEAEEPGLGLEREELHREVRRAVEELPANQRLALIMNKYDGLAYEQIAESMGLTVMAVKSLLMRARVKLKETLARHLRGHVS